MNITAATREPQPSSINWELARKVLAKLILATVVAGLVAFAVGGVTTAVLGLSWNTQGTSVGVSACSSIVSGGVYYDTTAGTVGSYVGCDY
jgi:hypothetical protein